MELKDRIVVVTGAAGGIGRALAQAFAEAGAKKIVCVDLDGDSDDGDSRRWGATGRWPEWPDPGRRLHALYGNA